jgi:hypothetical protein
VGRRVLNEGFRSTPWLRTSLAQHRREQQNVSWIRAGFRWLATGLTWLLLIPLWRALWRQWTRALRWAEALDERRAIQRAGHSARRFADKLEAERVRARQKVAKDQERAARLAAKKAAQDARAELHERAEASAAGMTVDEYRGVRRAEQIRKQQERDEEVARAKAPKPQRLALDRQRREHIARLVHGRPRVIVRKYTSSPFRPADKAFAEEAQILAEFGYIPTSQSFAANNVLTGIAIGTGDLIVSYARQTTE